MIQLLISQNYNKIFKTLNPKNVRNSLKTEISFDPKFKSWDIAVNFNIECPQKYGNSVMNLITSF